MKIIPIEIELSIQDTANPKFGDLSNRELNRYHGYGRKINGDLGNLLFDGYDTDNNKTILRNPAIETYIDGFEDWEKDEINKIASQILTESYEILGIKTVEH